MASIKGNLRFTEPCREGLRAASSSNFGYYARELMSNSVNEIQDEPQGSVDPARVLEKAYSSMKAKSSSTACIIALIDQVSCNPGEC